MPETPDAVATRPPDDGWRKAAVTIAGVAAVVALSIAGRIDGVEALATVGGMVGAYLGVNLWSRSRT